MWWITLVAAIGLWVGAVEPCYLSSDQPYSWIVSLRKIKTEIFTICQNYTVNFIQSLVSGSDIFCTPGLQGPFCANDYVMIACVGSLIAKNYVTAPLTCFQQRAGGGFFKGRDYLATAGEHSPGSCHQMRKGVLIMGHPKLADDKFKYNIAYLEVEPFDVDPAKPPVAPLSKSEKVNNNILAALTAQKAKCQLFWYKSDNGGDDEMKNQLDAVDVTMISRSRCWDTYCPSGNRGCVAYFWTSETYVCSIYVEPYNNEKRCKWQTIGAPLVCNGTAVGVLKSCYRDRPLMIQGYNKKQLKGIRLYQKIASGEEEVEPNGQEQEEPEFPKEPEDIEGNKLWRLG